MLVSRSLSYPVNLSERCSSTDPLLYNSLSLPSRPHTFISQFHTLSLSPSVSLLSSLSLSCSISLDLCIFLIPDPPLKIRLHLLITPYICSIISLENCLLRLLSLSLSLSLPVFRFPPLYLQSFSFIPAPPTSGFFYKCSPAPLPFPATSFHLYIYPS